MTAARESNLEPMRINPKNELIAWIRKQRLPNTT